MNFHFLKVCFAVFALFWALGLPVVSMATLIGLTEVTDHCDANHSAQQDQDDSCQCQCHCFILQTMFETASQEIANRHFVEAFSQIELTASAVHAAPPLPPPKEA